MPDAAQVEKLVRELIATGTMWPETVDDLERFVKEAQAGSLSPDDENYLVALHAKSVHGASAESTSGDAATETAVDWKSRAERAEARVSELEAELQALRGSSPPQR